MRAAIKKKFKDLNLKSLPPATTSTEPPPAVERSTTDDVLRSLGSTEQLWNEAYEAIKTKQPRLINLYEQLLTKELGGSTNDSNSIASDANRRQVQMRIILQKGLIKTETQAARKKTISNVTQTLMLVKDAVAAGLKPSSEATLAWTALTAALPLLHNSFEQSEKHRDGISRVSEILTKTDTLAPYRLETGGTGQNVLKTYILTLYEKLLSFLIQAACYCNRNKIGVIFQDAIKLDNWDIQIEEIQAAEKSLHDLDIEIKAQQTTQYQQMVLEELRNEKDKDNACLAKIMTTDPRLDKKRIEATKGGLLRDSYSWILNNEEFVKWEKDGGLLWIRGDPGKGKTMLLCGIIDELPKDKKRAYFFCQATNNAINTGIAVLRGLIYMLADQDTSLVPIIRERLDKSSNIFDGNSWFVLSEIIEEMITEDTCFIIDALDECIANRQQLIQLIRKTSNKVKWLVSSRNWSDIEDNLKYIPSLSLELNSVSVAKAVESYILYKIDQLANLKSYDSNTKNFVLSYLQRHANGTFLWVALVCKNLSIVRQRHVKSVLEKFPSDLDELYNRMWETVEAKDDASLLKVILGVCAIVVRPVSLEELKVILDIPEEASSSLTEVIQDCGSFLNIRQCVVEFVHQSAKEYIDKQPSAISNMLHYEVFRRSMEVMCCVLRKDIYGLADPAVSIDEVEKPRDDPLANISYSSTNWVHHLSKCAEHSEKNKDLLRQFLTYHYLPWLEAMSLLRSIPRALTMIHELEILAEYNWKDNSHPHNQDKIELRTLVWDARRFLQYFGAILEHNPLQSYYAGSIFSPENCLATREFPSLSSIRVLRYADAEWSPYVATIDARSELIGCNIRAACFSHDSERLAVGYQDGLIQIWHMTSLLLIQSVVIEASDKNPITRLAFTQAGDQVVYQYYNKTIGKWKLSANEIIPVDLTSIVAISPDGSIAAQRLPNLIKLYDLLHQDSTSCTCRIIAPWRPDSENVHERDKGKLEHLLVFSQNADCLAFCVDTCTIEVWYIQLTQLRYTIPIVEHRLQTMVLSNQYLSVITGNDSNPRSWYTAFYDLGDGNLIRPPVTFGSEDDFQVWMPPDNNDLVILREWTYAVTVINIISGAKYTVKNIARPLSVSSDLRYVIGQSGMEINLYEWSGLTTAISQSESEQQSNLIEIQSMSPDGGLVLITDDRVENRATLLDVDSMQELWRGANHTDTVYSPSLRLIMELENSCATADFKELQSLGLRKRSISQAFYEQYRENDQLVSIADDDSHIAAAMKSTEISVWNVVNREKVLSIKCSSSCVRLTWMPNRRKLVAALERGIVLVDLDTPDKVVQMCGATFMGFSEDGLSFMTRTFIVVSNSHKCPLVQRAKLDKENSIGTDLFTNNLDNNISIGSSNDSKNDDQKARYQQLQSYEWPIDGETKAGDCIQWNIVERSGSVLGDIDLPKSSSGSMKRHLDKLCYNDRFLVTYNTYGGLSDIDISLAKLTVWDKTSLKMMHQMWVDHAMVGCTIYLTNDQLHTDAGVIRIGRENLVFGTEHDVFLDGDWIWRNGTQLIRVPHEYDKLSIMYRNKVLGINTIHGGLLISKVA